MRTRPRAADRAAQSCSTQRAGAAPDRRRDRRAGHAELGERARAPKMSSGPSTMLIPFASQSMRIAIAASPAPRKIALIDEQQDDARLAAEHHARVADADARAPRRSAPISASSCGAKHDADHAEHDGHDERRARSPARRRARRPRRPSRRCGARPPPSRRWRGPSPARRRREQRLGEADRRDGVGAEARDEEDVGDGEDASITISSTIGTASITIAGRPAPPCSRDRIRERPRGTGTTSVS